MYPRCLRVCPPHRSPAEAPHLPDLVVRQGFGPQEDSAQVWSSPESRRPVVAVMWLSVISLREQDPGKGARPGLG